MNIKLKEFLKLIVLPIFSGIGLLHITTTYLHADLGILRLFFRAAVIGCMLMMWCYGLDKLKEVENGT